MWNRPFYSCVLSDFSYVDHEKQWGLYQNKVTPASLPIQGQVTKHTTVKWPIAWFLPKTCDELEACSEEVLAVSIKWINDQIILSSGRIFNQLFYVELHISNHRHMVN